jgi:hypothetical protein
MCDGISHTIVIIKTSSGKVFGGYTPCQWSKGRDGNFEADRFNPFYLKDESFLFSLTEKIILENKYSRNALYQDKDNGPVFGGGFDLAISNHSDRNLSKAHIGYTYRHYLTHHKDPIGYSLFSGSPDGEFKTAEWEVFQLQFD